MYFKWRDALKLDDGTYKNIFKCKKGMKISTFAFHSHKNIN